MSYTWQRTENCVIQTGLPSRARMSVGTALSTNKFFGARKRRRLYHPRGQLREPFSDMIHSISMKKFCAHSIILVVSSSHCTHFGVNVQALHTASSLNQLHEQCQAVTQSTWAMNCKFKRECLRWHRTHLEACFKLINTSLQL